VEKRLLSAIHIRFGLPPVLADEITRQIKAADRGAAYLEGDGACSFAQAEAKRLFGRDSWPASGERAGLSHALDRGQGRKAVPGAVQDAASMNIDAFAAAWASL